MNITTRTTKVSNVQLDDNIWIWLLEEEGFTFKSAPETWKLKVSVPKQRQQQNRFTTENAVTYLQSCLMLF